MLSDEQIEAAFAEAQSGAPYMGVCTKRQFADAIESAATAPLLEQLAERDKRIAELERKSDQDDETIVWQANKIAMHIDRIAELEEMNAQLREQNTAVDQACAEFERELEAEREDVQRFRNHAMNEKDARRELELELESVRKDAERWQKLREEHERVDPICHVIWKKNDDRNSSE